ncbi:MAG: ArsA family ATPase [Thermoplasmataceae archaeon]|nr:ArsA family ATPase [Candidatus Thermoplasmatota archaeon]
MTRVILYTGKGGVGKTSMAAATAVGLANSGKSTLIISTDPAHSLGDALNMDVGPRVKTVFKNLDAQEVSVVEAISSHWGELKVYLAALFQSQGLDPVSAEEIATLPGFDEASHLLYLNDYLKSNRYDVIVMDSAPTGEALKLLSFPEAMSWYMEKVFPIGRTTARIVRPFMKPIIGMPLPDDTVFASMDSLYKNLKKVREVLIDNSITSIRLVCNPDRMSFNETKRAYTYLLLYGYPVDALIVNKIFADNVGDFFLKWKENQREIIKEIDESFREIKVLKVYLSDEEPIGREYLTRLSKKIYEDSDPMEIFFKGKPIEYYRLDNRNYVKVKLPFAKKESMNLYNKGGELVIEIENWRRVFYLPQSLSDKSPGNAEFINGHLNIELV